MRRSIGWVCSTLVATTGAAVAGPDAIVTTTGGDEHDAVVRTTVDYDVAIESSRILREAVGAAGTDPLARLPVRDDLDASHVRHTVTPRLELAFAPGLWLTAALPIVATDSRSLSLHDGVTRADSSTLADGLLPMTGYDAEHPDAGFADGDSMVFRGRSRHGLDQVIVGAGAALMNQRRDSTKPTWKLGAEVGLAIGKVARFDAMDPGANTAIGRGTHELRLWTTVAKRYAFAEPYFGLSWQAAIATKDASLFRDLGYGSTNVRPQQQAELRFGVEAVALDHPKDDLRVGLDLGSRVKAHFEGRDYSELWEVFALAGDARVPGSPLVLDHDPTAPGLQALSHPGISNIENYLEVGGNLAVRAQLGRHFHLDALAEVMWKTDHTITFADAGIDLPTCAAGQTSGCELANNDLIDAGTEEENPAFVTGVDLVGHRYRSVDGLAIVLGVRMVGSF